MPPSIILYDPVSKTRNEFSIDGRIPNLHSDNIVSYRGTFYGFHANGDYNEIFTQEDSVWKTNVKSFDNGIEIMQADYRSGTFDLHTYDVETRDISSIYGLPDSLISISGIINNHYLIASEFRSPYFLYDISCLLYTSPSPRDRG